MERISNAKQSYEIRGQRVRFEKLIRKKSPFQVETEMQITPEDTLIVLDEIQEAEGGLTSLKYFCENAPEYHIIAAGSLLGVALHKTKSFPVGKVDFMDLYPLDFPEFLLAMRQPLLDLLKSKDWELTKV